MDENVVPLNALVRINGELVDLSKMTWQERDQLHFQIAAALSELRELERTVAAYIEANEPDWWAPGCGPNKPLND